MPILKQARKAMRRDKNRAVFNLRRKKEMKEQIKKVRTLVFQKAVDEAKKALPQAYKAIDKAAKRGVVKKNTAARYKSRLAALLKKSS